MRIDSIPARLFTTAKRQGSKPAYHERIGGTWTPTSWTDYAAQTRQAARALLALKLKPGEKVCILGFNKPEWVLMDVAAMTAGGAPAGIYTTCSPEEVAYIIDHSEARIVLLEDESQWAKVDEMRKKLKKLKHVVMMRGAPRIDDKLVMSWDEFLAKGDGVDDAKVEERLDGLKEDDVATFIYTSGTTGPPKAVMLTHRNLAWTATAAIGLADLSDSDISVSYLPLSHIAEQMFTIHAPITVGSTVYYAESLENLASNIAEVRPTVMFGVPRIWEKFHAKVSGALDEAEGFKAKLVSWALAQGRRHTDAINAGESPRGIRYGIADKLVLSKVRAKMGLDRAHMCVTGAAPIAPEILEFFAGLGLTIHEVYGQSEDCGPTTFNLKGNTRYGTVGTKVPGTEVKIADDGEILVKGPHVFAGYYKDKAATEATLIDGWLQTGDLGAFDGEHLKITGRKKEIIITAGGKNIAPKNIESALKNCPIVSQAVVIGDRRKFLSALITLDPEQGLDPSSQAVQDQVQAWVDTEVNPLFARVEHVRKFTILPRDFTIDDGELTPTLKIKRGPINANWADTIEEMYAEKALKSAK